MNLTAAQLATIKAWIITGATRSGERTPRTRETTMNLMRLCHRL